MQPNGSTATGPREGLADALGQVLAETRADWRRERALAEAETARTIAELRAEVAGFRLQLGELVATRLAALTNGQDGAEGPMGPAGERGLQGERGERGEVGPEGPPGGPGPAGADGEPGSHGRDGDQGPRGEPGERGERGEPGPGGEAGPAGEDGADGEPGPPGMLPIAKEWFRGVHYAADVVTWLGATWQATRDTAEEPPHPDWTLLAARGVDAPVGEVRGAYDPEAHYQKFDLVALNGSEWRARQDDPGPLPGDGWQLSGMRGERGGRGQPGERGPVGPQGAPGSSIAGWVRDGYSAIPILTDGSAGPPLDLREFFEAYHAEAIR